MLLFPLYLYYLTVHFMVKYLKLYNILIWSNYNIFQNNILVVSSVFLWLCWIFNSVEYGNCNKFKLLIKGARCNIFTFNLDDKMRLLIVDLY